MVELFCARTVFVATTFPASLRVTVSVADDSRQNVGCRMTWLWSMSVMTCARSRAFSSTGSIHTVCQIPVQRVYMHSNWLSRTFCFPAGCLVVRVSL